MWSVAFIRCFWCFSTYLMIQYFICSLCLVRSHCFFFFQAEDGIRDTSVTGVQTCALPIWPTAGHRTEQTVVVDEVDERLAADDDHEARSVGLISPDPRGISVTGTMWWTEGDASPSRRRKRKIGRASCREGV